MYPTSGPQENLAPTTVPLMARPPHTWSRSVCPDQAAGFAALARFIPLLIGGGTDDDTQLAKILAEARSVRPFGP